MTRRHHYAWTPATTNIYEVPLRPDAKNRDGLSAEKAVEAALISAGAITRNQVPFPDPLKLDGSLHKIDVVGDFLESGEEGARVWKEVLVSVRTTMKGSNWSHGTLHQEVDRLSLLLKEGYADYGTIVLAGDGWKRRLLGILPRIALEDGVKLQTYDSFRRALDNETSPGRFRRAFGTPSPATKNQTARRARVSGPSPSGQQTNK